jgi:predicted molibdopterin-dependent oxidoreductase YjgC
MVTLTIDGVEVSVERGTSILDAARQAGIRIPTLCHDERLVPYGACRLCMVEVTARGRTRRMPACFNPARDGMEVATHTPDLIKGRRIQLMLLLRTHPLLCPSCDAGGNCRLQDLVHEYEVPELPFPTESRYFHVDNASPFIRHNMNLCIKCGMCVRICDEVQGVNQLSFVERGITSEVSTDFGRPLECEFCGQCAQICPVGAISSKWLVGTGRDFELKKTDTTCAFCSLGCTLTLGEKSGKVVSVSSPPESHNEGNLCVKGRYGWPYLYSEERLSSPLVNKGGKLEEAEWNEALSFVAERLGAVKGDSGPLSLAALGSERLTNEEAYVFNRFVRTVMETPHLDHAGGYGYRGLVDGLMPILGYPASTNPITEIRDAELVLLVGADLTESHPVAKNEVILATGTMRRGEVIVIDSVETRLAERPGKHLAVAPGTEHLVLYSMLKEVIDQGLFDKAALDLRAEGFDEFAASLDGYSPDAAAPIAGIDAELIREAAKRYAEAAKAAIILTDGMNRLGLNALCARAAASLALVTGKLGKPSCGVYVFGEKANAQGAVDMGLAPDLLPGFKKIDDEEARSRFEEAWGSPLPAEKGMSAREILAKAESGEIKALYIVGENPLDTYPDRARVERALGKLELLVVQDMFLTSTAKMAHAVLPVTAFAEKTGTLTSAERRVQRLRPVLRPRGAKSDLEIFSALAALMGKPVMTYAGPEQVMYEIAELVEPYRGVSYDRIGDTGILWPCVDEEDPGTAILYEGGFPGGKAALTPAPAVEPGRDNGYPMVLIQGLSHFHSGSWSEWSSALMEVCPEGPAELNPGDMEQLGVGDGDKVKITSPEGLWIQVKAERSLRPAKGTVIVPQHFSALKLNSLTGWDTPVVKVKVEKV